MPQLSGLTIDQLEELCNMTPADQGVIAAVHNELLRRKALREQAGKTEKLRAKRLRITLARTLGIKANAGTKPRQTKLTPRQAKPESKSSQQLPSLHGPRASPRRLSRNQVRRDRDVGFTPTKEQEEAVRAFRTGDDLKINAFAGSGKTSTLALLARESHGTGLYLAFNNACVTDAAKRFSGNVTCRTLHSTAIRTLRCHFSKEKLVGALTPNIVLSYFSIPVFDCGSFRLSDRQVASLALTTFRRFAYSSETDIAAIPLPRLGHIALVQPPALGKLAATIYQLVAAMWKKMCDRSSAMPLGHDGYLKYWTMQKPTLNADFILLDEAQDTNDVVIDLLARQNCQVVYVGDRHQQIYEWRGAVNALDKVCTPVECALTKSFRFGSSIATLANAILQRMGEDKKIVGNERVCSSVGFTGHPDAIIARSNGAVLAAVMATLESGMTPYVEGGKKDLVKLLRGVFDLGKHGFSNVPEFFGFTSWEQVVEYSETEYGQELATFVRLVETYGAGPLWHLLKDVADKPSDAAVTISTTHRAKGREWDSVRLEDDFVHAEADEDGKPHEPGAEELRILYVALTRAKTCLQIGEQTARFIGA